MGILDTTYEQNSFDTNTPTITYSNGEYTPTTNEDNSTNLPIYVSIKNNIDTHKPSLCQNTISPFEDNNPDLKNLFGLHIYDKKFGFSNLKIVNPTNNYPYSGLKSENYGKLYNYDGIISGYVLNGVSDDDVTVSIDDENYGAMTLNEDSMENPRTLRLIYTLDSKAINNQYGKYIVRDTYFYVPMFVSYETPTPLIPEPIPHVTYGFLKSTSCVFYKKLEDNTYSEVAADEVNGTGFYIIRPKFVIGETNQIEYIEIKNNSVYTCYDESGMVYYMKDENNNYNATDSSSYQYIETNNSMSTLTISDGYGDDGEVDVMQYLETPSSIELCKLNIGGVVSTVLKVDRETINMFDSFNMYKVNTGSNVEIEEPAWSSLPTIKEDIEEKSNNIIVHVVRYKDIFSTKYTTKEYNITATYSRYKAPYSIESGDYILRYLEVNYVINSELYNYIKNARYYNWCKNNTTGYETTKDDSIKKWLVVIAGGDSGIADHDYCRLKYYIDENDDGSANIRLNWAESAVYSVNAVPTYLQVFDNYFYFDRNEYVIKFLSHIINVNPVNIHDDGMVYTTLTSCNADVLVSSDGVNIDNTDYQYITVDDVQYKYKLNTMHIDNGNNLPYPQDSKTAIFELIKDNEWDNKLSEIIGPEYKYYQIAESESIFMVATVGSNTDYWKDLQTTKDSDTATKTVYIEYDIILTIKPKVTTNTYSASDDTIHYLNKKYTIPSSAWSLIKLLPTQIRVENETDNIIAGLNSQYSQIFCAIAGISTDTVISYTIVENTDTNEADITITYRVDDSYIGVEETTINGNIYKFTDNIIYQYVFGNDDTTVYYIYSPKIDIETPIVYANENTNYVVVTGKNKWTDENDITTNIYLRYYDFTLTRLGLNDDGEYVVLENIYISNEDTELKKFSDGTNEFYGYKIDLSINDTETSRSNDKYTITDCTGLINNNLILDSTEVTEL